MTEVATIDAIREGPEREAAARSTMYQYLATWLSFPWEPFMNWRSVTNWRRRRDLFWRTYRTALKG